MSNHNHAHQHGHQHLPQKVAALSLNLQGLDCSDCALVVEHRLKRLAGIVGVNVDYAEQTLQVEYDPLEISPRIIERKIEQLGYSTEGHGLRYWLRENRELVFSLLSGLALLTGWLGGRFAGFPPAISLALYGLAYFLGGVDITQHALHALRRRHFDTDLLMVLAALGAAALGEFAEGALLLFLFSLGHALEERALARARRAVSALAELAPRTALMRSGDELKTVGVDRLLIGDTVVVQPGVRVPVDGEVTAGVSSVDQSPVTGESMPVEKRPGEQVYAGSVNGEGVLDVQVNRLARDSTLARVMAMVEQAQAQKSPTQQSTERFMRVFVPLVILGDLLLIVIPPLFGVPFEVAFLRGMTLLVAASPCALALGTPTAILAGVAQAARNGVLLKGGVHLENLGRLKAVAFDKTGTLTLGKPRVTDVIAWQGHSEAEVLSLAAAVEGRSAHPLAQAILEAAVEKQLVPVPEAAEVEARTGRGIQARVFGQRVWIGSQKLLAEAGIAVPAEAQRRQETLEDQGKSVILVAQDRELIGMVALADVARPSARAALAALEQLGVGKTIMLSGDNPRAVAHIAGQLGVSEYRANLMPEDKLTTIRDLVTTYGVVGMVGDGVNDAPALAHATVGIAMGGGGTDVALETADVALIGGDLNQLPFAVGLGRQTRRIIQQNLALALGVIAVLVVLSVTGLTGIGMAVVIHEGSTLLVALNALRLLNYRPA